MYLSIYTNILTFMSRSSIPRSMAVESLPPEKETR